MNNSIFGQAQDAYNNQDYARALELFNSTLTDESFPLEPGELGLLYHQIGNCFVKLKKYTDAINSYTNATTDTQYGHVGTVFYNLGMAYTFLNDFSNAVANFQIAVDEPTYQSKYKAYTAMGNALMKSGKSPEAGAVFRAAAMDPNNPDPTRALLNLGVCFMALGRPNDAVIAYESAFQFDVAPYVKNRLNANLGQAYVATGQMQKAVEAFDASLEDKSYVLSDSASVDYQRAIAAVSKGNDNLDMQDDGKVDLDQQSSSDGNSAKVAAGVAVAGAAGVAAGAAVAGSEQANAMTDLQEAGQPASASEGVAKDAVSNLTGLDVLNTDDAPVAGYTNYADSAYADSVQPIDPSADNQFNSEDADFEAWTTSTKEAGYNQKKKHSGGKIFLVVLLCIIAIALASGVFLFTQGYGIPTQEMVTNELFTNPVTAKEKVFASELSSDKIERYSSMVSNTTDLNIQGVDRSMTESTVYASAKTTAGGTVDYKIKMIRNLVGWKIYVVDLNFASQA